MSGLISTVSGLRHAVSQYLNPKTTDARSAQCRIKEVAVGPTAEFQSSRQEIGRHKSTRRSRAKTRKTGTWGANLRPDRLIKALMTTCAPHRIRSVVLAENLTLDCKRIANSKLKLQFPRVAIWGTRHKVRKDGWPLPRKLTTQLHCRSLCSCTRPGRSKG